ncbi:rho GTPase-activating protein 12 isoform 1 [Mus musculus]|uniref:Rho GTPase-activating protein 12 n=1 Tax=Mus musculus TaxID=10090 RepID=RHG12_MOUSE|nr:rho GTPase-activating protein 12 isoform 1 [Mus musculus]Q8C0D4.2 RecName: Full=Rho GTPase-activating protein 12; AltName: Full=Rho-type GTPase-activating protein 12 [Mus musculus]EDL23036.1 Rho GTPase activating protein 12, isoform CRA_a [Mus musculus]|eukprot:NP_001034781.1 rho GTPase-activating protein 12 isoform 1 [Mus musculus]
MAERSGKITAGQAYIEVEYDYEYDAKDRKIVIRQGERYLLVKKTNDDWWQVRPDENSKAFYVPAQYVKEVTRKALMPPVKQATGLPNNSMKTIQSMHLQRSTENVNKMPELSSFGKPSSSVQGTGLIRDANQNFGSNYNSGQTLNLSLDLTHNNGKFNSDSHSPKVSSQNRTRLFGHFPGPEFLDIEKTSFSQEQSCDSAGEGSERIQQDSESGDELSSSSTEQMRATTPPNQGRPDSPVYANLQELKISQSALPPLPGSPAIQVNGEWETHKDSSGRCYYYNRTTQERTWKPPRWARDVSTSRDFQSPGEQEPLSSEENYHSSCFSQSDSQCGSPPRGWSEELDERGHTLYTSDYTKEKWLKHVDDQGRQYYYSADGSRSEWELPKYNASSQQQREIIKSRSLDRRLQEPIVLTKWRHSTIVLDSNDKDSPTTTKLCLPENESPPTSSKHQDPGQEKYGLLNVTKITENGKKVRKNWLSSWAVLQGSSLLFTKTQGSSTSWFGSNQSKPEFTVDLKGAVIEMASKDKSSKKNVFELKTRQGTELLIQSDNDAVINDWFKVLSSTINNQVAEADEAAEEETPDSPGVEKHDKEKDQKELKKLRSMKGSSMDSSEQKKTKKNLKKFLTRRPTLQAVREKGYIKDQVFGSNLANLCQRENGTVPKFVKLCIEHVEEHGLDVDGIYRVSGNLAVIQKLRFAVNHDEKLDLNDSKWEDIHVITGALKMFFRELPEPLFTFNHFNDFVNAIKQEPRQRVTAVKDLIRQLPKPNQDTMQILFRHLKRVIENGEKNRMTYQSIAIVFGPTLLKPERETGNIAVHTVYQNQIVELILLELSTVFGR